MNTFSGLTSALGSALPGFMNNPFGTQQFKMGQQLGTSQANNMNQTATNGLVNNMIGSGMAGGASNPAATEMLQNQNRANTSNTANLGFIQPTQNALQMQQNAIGTAAGYKPLQTGGTNTQSTQGLGTWLPQLLGGGLGMLGNIATGGLSGGLFGSGNPQMQGFQGGNINRRPAHGLIGWIGRGFALCRSEWRSAAGAPAPSGGSSFFGNS